MLKIQIELDKRVAAKDSGMLAMAGWHNNYVEFSFGELKGIVTFINGNVSILIDCKNSYTFNIEKIIDLCIKDFKK